MARASKSGITLTKADARIVKGMLERRDRHHDIAAWFGVNGGRIGEISTGKNFSDVTPKLTGLPPVGPYMPGRNSNKALKSLKEFRGKLSNLLNEVDRVIQDLE